MLRLITSNLVGCLILTSICFTMAIAIWKSLVAYFKRQEKIQLIIGWIGFVLILGIVPVVYLGDKAIYGMKYLVNTSIALAPGTQMWHTFSNSLMPFVYGFLIIWLIGTLAATGYFCIQKAKLNRVLAFRDKVSDERVLYWFEKTKTQLGITREINLYEDILMTTPATLTWDKQAVVIPKRYYTDRELQVMFTHELLHIRNKDYRKKQMSIMTCCIHWYNPMSWHFFKEMNKWCETGCDCEAVKFLATQNISVGEYFTILLDVVHRCNKESIWLTWSESGGKEEWERRFSAATGNLKVNDMKKTTVGIVTLALAISLSSTVYAAGLQVDKLNTEYALDTMVEYEEDYVSVTYEETVETLTEEQMAAIPVDETAVIPTTDEAARDLSSVNWTLEAGGKLRGAYVYLHAGDTVDMAGLIDPDGVRVKVGLICSSSGTLTSISTTTDFVHTFTISANGFYAIYAENLGTQTVTLKILV